MCVCARARITTYRSSKNLLPVDSVLELLFNKTNSFKDISDVIYTPLLDLYFKALVKSSIYT